MRVVWTLLVVCLSLLSTRVLAQDQCKDVLVNAVLDLRVAQRTEEFRLAALSTLATQNDDQNNLELAAAFPINGVPVEGTGSWTRTHSSKVESTFDLDLAYSNRGSLLLQSGQEEIVRAWRDCMINRGGGLGLHFEKIADGSSQVFLRVEYIRSALVNAVQNQVKLTNDVFLPEGVRIAAGERCVKQGLTLDPGETCVSQVIVPSAWSVVPIVMSFEDSSGNSIDIYDTLLPRVGARLDYITQPITIPSIYVLDIQETQPEICVDAADGYTFTTVRINTQPLGAAIANNTCQSGFSFNTDRDRVCIQANATGSVPAKADYYCNWQAEADAAKVEFLPPNE